MTQAQVIEGTPKEIQDHLKTLNGNMRLTLIVPAESEQVEALKNLYHATPEELQAIDEADRSGIATDGEVEAAFRAFRNA